MILAILQARVSSSRFPKKVIQPILGKAMLLRQIERVLNTKQLNHLIVATSTHTSDDVLEKLCVENKIDCFRGSLNDVLDRFYQASLKFNPTHIVRITGDCPLLDPFLIDEVISQHIKGNFDYTSNVVELTFADGLDVEIFSASALEKAWKQAKLPSEREHVTAYFFNHPELFKKGNVRSEKNFSHLRWTVDEPEDFKLVTKIYEELYPKNNQFTKEDVLNLFEEKKELLEINKKFQRNEGLKVSLRKDFFTTRYSKSNSLLERALKTIPLASQTFSKSKTQYPMEVSPFFIKKGKGSHVWDVDGNEYIDFVNSLASITLGYLDPDVTKAVKEQIEEGVIFSLPHPIEMEVAEKIVEFVPCAEKVRFGKNGSDATAGAIRLSRAFTKRDHVAVCGYHGWQDWYIGSTARNLGVPQSTRDLTHSFTYNNIDSLHQLFQKFPNQIAAVVLEPMNVEIPANHFLEEVKNLTHKNGAVLVFDEIITGFRFAKGGAQELFNVTPDLASFGKGIANGYPLAALAGRAEIMNLMDDIFFSFTYGGETLSLAAAKATLTKLEKQPVIPHLYKQGEKILSGLTELIKKHDAQNIFSVAGNPAWNFFFFKDTEKYSQWQIKTLYLQEMFSRGILTIGTHNMSYAHSDEDISKLLTAYDEVLDILTQAVQNNNLERQLFAKPLVPLFKVR